MSKHKHNFGSTIVELLIVIVVVAVLVSLSIVGYSTISSKATVSAVQADLTNAKKQILAFQSQSTSNSFPTAINCSSPSATEICIKPSGSTSFTYNVNNSTVPSTFNLTATNGTSKYWINDSSSVLTTANIVTDGLVLNLDAANPDSYSGSGTTWYDLSGNGNNGALNSGIAYRSSYFAFNNNGFVSVPDANSLDLPNNLTVSMWFYVDSWLAGNYSHAVMEKWGSTGNANWRFYLGGSYAPNGLWILATANGSWGGVAYFSPITNGKWVSITWTYNGTTSSSYLYSTLNSTQAVTQPLATNTNALTIGRDLIGRIGAVHIYNRALSQSEVTQNYNAIRERYGI